MGYSIGNYQDNLTMSITPAHIDGQGAVYLGDCADALPAIRCKADLILTSPPYDNLRNYGGHGFDFDAVADACVDALKPGGVIVWVIADATIDGSETGTSFRQALGFMERGLRLHDTMIYRKSGSNGMTNPGRHQNGFEFMFIFSQGRPATVNIIADIPTSQAGRMKTSPTHRQTDGGMEYSNPYRIPALTARNNVWEYDPGFNKCHPGYPQAHQHPATFPYALAIDHVRTWTNPGDLVLDPMAGSGTAIRAAKDLGRQYVGIEIYEPYVDIIRDRLAQEVLIGHV